MNPELPFRDGGLSFTQVIMLERPSIIYPTEGMVQLGVGLSRSRSRGLNTLTDRVEQTRMSPTHVKLTLPYNLTPMPRSFL